MRQNSALDTRDFLARDGEEFTEVVRQIRKVEKRILLLADVYKSGTDGGHHLANTSQVDVAEGSDVVRMFYVEFYEFAILHDGDARTVLARIDDDFFLHGGW